MGRVFNAESIQAGNGAGGGGETWLELGAGNVSSPCRSWGWGCRVIALDLQQNMLDMLESREPPPLRS